jgi:hypothetical protein
VKLREQLTTARAAIGVAASLIVALLWLFSINSKADQALQTQRSQQEQLEILTDIHAKQDAAEEARRKLIVSLCSEGKLVGPDCCKVNSLRGCPPTKPPPSGGP